MTRNDDLKTSTRTSAGATRSAVPTDAELARSLGGGFRSDHVTADGLRLHYVAGGTGKPLLLLPGWPETWWEFRKVMPALAAAGRRVIAADLPGMGTSAKPAGGYDKKSMATAVRGLVRALGYDRVDIAGHDIGAQIAFSFAANHPEATGRIAMLDILHPDESVYELRMVPLPGQPYHPWWFAFNQVAGLPERLLAGRSRLLVDWIFDNFLLNRDAVGELDRAVYAHHYDDPDNIRGGNAWYGTFGQDVVDLADYGRVTAPVLGMVSNLADGAFAAQMRATLPNQATDVRVVVVPDSGHYLVEESPQTVIDHFTEFFA
ncbi:alpha/beta fold hydrolase [Saccharothrix texasensis]|uniref:alpha/beta fold hydrolase n=1 Tax=Saccharothrix texasensis TaxID=103734 RepID=UPI001FEC060D|nr:alpha/beta hydrolase [Saccharothrix texasensis]